MRQGLIKTRSIEDVVSNQECISCGFCQIPISTNSSNTPEAADVQLAWSNEYEQFIPNVDTNNMDDGNHRICPGDNMDMQSLAESTFNRQPDNPITGEVISTHAGYATNINIRKQAASGGITTAILTYLLDNNIIQIAYCSSASGGPKDSKGMLVRSSEDLLHTTGSHYHPVNFGSCLQELVESNVDFAFVGLPCEVASFRNLMLYKPELKKRCKLVIGLFCGGINRFNTGIGYYLKQNNVEPDDVEHIDYRAGNWPGHIKLVTKAGQKKDIPRIKGNTRYKILKYMIGFQGYGMLLRCRICPDQISDFADISVGDPHLPRFKSQDSSGWSAIVTRTETGKKILDDALSSDAIHLEHLSIDEVIQSQGYTLENRRNARIYVTVAKKIGLVPPNLTVYKKLEDSGSFHTYVYAFVDLFKIKIRHHTWLKAFYLPIQIFEYLFLTFSPRLFIQRVKKLSSNK